LIFATKIKNQIFTVLRTYHYNTDGEFMKKLKDKNALFNRYIFGDDPALVNAKYYNNLKVFINHLLPATLTTALVSGAFLTGVMMHMGFSDNSMAMIALIPSILGIFSLLAGPFLEKRKSKKPFVVASIVLVNFFRTAVVFIPYIVSRKYYLPLFIAMYCIAFGINAILAVAFNNLYINSMERSIQAKYIGLRNKINLIFNIVFPIIFAAIVDMVPEEKKYIAFTVMFTCGFICGCIEAYIVSKLQEPETKKMDKKDINLKNIILIPIKNKEFIKLNLIAGAFYLTYFISGSFLSVFMLKYMGMSYSVFTLGITISYVIQFLTYGIGGKIVHRFGSKLPTALGVLLHSSFSLFYVFVTAKTAPFWYCLSYIILAIFVPTFNIAIYKYRFDVASEKGQTYYDGFYTAVVGVVILIAPMIGGFLKDIIEATPFLYGLFEYAQFKLLFFISFLTMALTGVLALRSVKKSSDYEKVTSKEFKRFILNETFIGKIIYKRKLKQYKDV
jgi:MFS family permease